MHVIWRRKKSQERLRSSLRQQVGNAVGDAGPLSISVYQIGNALGG